MRRQGHWSQRSRIVRDHKQQHSTRVHHFRIEHRSSLGVSVLAPQLGTLLAKHRIRHRKGKLCVRCHRGNTFVQRRQMEGDFALLQEWNGKVRTPFGAQHTRTTQVDVAQFESFSPANSELGFGIRVGRTAAGEHGIVGVAFVVELIG